MAVAIVAVYALLFNALLSAAAGFSASPLPDGIICTHDSGGSDQPAAPSSAHDDVCCVATCGAMAAAIVAPSDYSSVLLAPSPGVVALTWAVAIIAPSPPPRVQTSPRGPPSLI
jgi:hypothetical protein